MKKKLLILLVKFAILSAVFQIFHAYAHQPLTEAVPWRDYFFFEERFYPLHILLQFFAYICTPLLIELFSVGVLIMLLFRFRYKKSENLRLSRHTLIIGGICAVLSVFSCVYALHSAGWHPLMVQIYIILFLESVLLVALFEELVYRGFVTNELFRMKQCGLKTPAAIAISAVLFGFVHLPFALPTLYDSWYAGAAALLGAALAIILYYKKDIVIPICIHAANNILYTFCEFTESILVNTLYVGFYLIFVIGYPVYLVRSGRAERNKVNPSNLSQP